MAHGPFFTSILPIQSTLKPMSLTENLLRGSLPHLLHALDFLHTEAHIIHTGTGTCLSMLKRIDGANNLAYWRTDVQAKKILIGATNCSFFEDWAGDKEFEPQSEDNRRLFGHLPFETVPTQEKFDLKNEKVSNSSRLLAVSSSR